MGDSLAQADWRCWVEEHAPQFLLFARQRCCSEADAQDLVQEALSEAVRRQGDGSPPPPALVFATIHRRAIDLARREDRRTGRELAAMEPQPGAWFDAQPEDRELRLLIQDAVRRLPDIYREVIVIGVAGRLSKPADKLQSQSTAASLQPALAADDVEIDRQLVAAYDAVARMPNGEPVRFRCREWMDEVVLRDSARGIMIEQRTPHLEVIPVSFDTY